MSCSVKISSGKSWSGSQRRIGSLPEETTAAYPGQAAVPASGNVLAPQSGANVNASGTPSNSSYSLTSHHQSQLTTPGQAPRPAKSIAAKKGEDTTKLLKYIDDNVIGKNGTFFGPFGRRKGTYFEQPNSLFYPNDPYNVCTVMCNTVTIEQIKNARVCCRAGYYYIQVP